MPPAPPSSPAALDALLAACRRGEPTAQQRIYDWLAPRLLVVCRRYVRGGDAEAEDVLQRVMLKILTRSEQWRGQGPFEAWARRIAVNTALHGWRREELRRTTTTSWGDDSPPLDIPATDASALDHLSAEDLLALLDTLPPGYRMILNLYAVEGLSHPEIAQLLGISEGTSRSQLTRARAALEKKLQRQSALPLVLPQ